VPDQDEQDDDRNGNAEEPEKNAATHETLQKKRLHKIKAVQLNGQTGRGFRGGELGGITE
jgi:hypothetical protein